MAKCQMSKKAALKILNLNAGATKNEIKKAYREASRDTHPDKKGGTTDEMMKLNNAKDTLLSGCTGVQKEDSSIGYDIAYKSKLKGALNDMSELKSQMYGSYMRYDYSRELNDVFPSNVKATLNEQGNIEFKVVSTGKSVIIPGSKITVDSILQAVSKSGTQAPVGFNGFDYLMANKDLFENLVDPAQHYMNYGAKEGRNPSKFFNEKEYLSMNLDVKAAVEKGDLLSGFAHFANYGCKEGRSPDGIYDEEQYSSSNPDIASLKMSGAMQCAYFHCIEFGFMEGRDGCADIL